MQKDAHTLPTVNGASPAGRRRKSRPPERSKIETGVPWRSGREVIRAVVPHGTAENRERFEAVMLCYVSLYERTRDGYIGDVLTRIGLRVGGELLAAYELQT